MDAGFVVADFKMCAPLHKFDMDASQYKDYVLVILFIKYISDKAKDPLSMINLPEGCSFADMVKLKNKPGIGDARGYCYPF